MSEKLLHLPRSIFSLITICIVTLIFISSAILQFRNTSVIPSIVLGQLPVDTTISPPNPLHGIVSEQVQLTSETHEGYPSRSKEKVNLCSPNKARLQVFMYDLPPEFHFGLLGWKGSSNEIWPNVSDPSKIPPYPGGLNMQHSIEYWLTLDLLASNTPSVVRPCTAVRVHNSSEADVIFVPFFSSLSYNRYSKLHGKEKVSVNAMLQSKLVPFLTNRDEWKSRGGKDHLVLAHHPNSMLNARKILGSAMFVLADFGRYPKETANLEKDIIAPYKHVVRAIPSNQSAPFEKRPILAYFQGAIYRKDVSASLYGWHLCL